MSQKSKHIASIIFFVFWILIMVWFGSARNIKPDLSGDGGYEPTRGVGHPLWQDY